MDFTGASVSESASQMRPAQLGLSQRLAIGGQLGQTGREALVECPGTSTKHLQDLSNSANVFFSLFLHALFTKGLVLSFILLLPHEILSTQN